MREVWVMGSGPSAKEKLKVTGDIIAVNKDAFRYSDEATYTITMDNRFVTWELTNLGKKLPETATNIFVVNMENEYMVHTKTFVDRRWGVSYDLSAFDMIVKSRKSDGLGCSFKDFRTGGNSGFCALQLAVVLGYKTIHLVGIDLTISGGRTHHHEGYPEPCKEFQTIMDSYVPNFLYALKVLKTVGVEVINHSPVSPLKKEIGYVPV